MTEQANLGNLYSAIEDYERFRTGLTAYGHIVSTERTKLGEKIVRIEPNHHLHASNAEAVERHLQAILSQAKIAHETAQKIARALSENGEGKMENWQLVRNLRTARDELLKRTQEHIDAQLVKIADSLPRVTTRKPLSFKAAQTTARLHGLEVSYKKFASLYAESKKKLRESGKRK